MSSEVLKFIIENSNNLSSGDFIILSLVLLSLTASVSALIHWIYRHAFQMQGEVVRSQAKLIEVKDQAIAQYEKSIGVLKEENILHKEAHALHSEKLKSLEEEYKTEKTNSNNLLLYAASHQMGVLIAQALILRLELCGRFRFLIRVYATVKDQHSEQSGIDAGVLYAYVDEVEEVIWQRAKLLDVLDKLTIEQVGESGVPRQLNSKSRSELDEKFQKLEQGIVTATLPILKKYEPDFASRVHIAYTKKFDNKAQP